MLEVSRMLQPERFPVISIRNVIAAGSCVVVESTGQATAKTGRPYNQACCDIFRFMGDQIQEITTYLDTALSDEGGREI